MNSLKCPHCGKVFSVDEADYAFIVNQVKSTEFENELEKRVKEIKNQLETEQTAKTLELNQSYEKKLNEKEIAITLKDAEIIGLKSEIKEYGKAKKAEIEAECAKKDAVIATLQAQLSQSKDATEIAVMKAKEESQDMLQKKELEIATLKNQIDQAGDKAQIEMNSVKANYELQLKQQQEMVEYYKDMKAHLSTKMIGESLEIHCSNEFNRIRTSAYPNAYFEKDNDDKSGTKGDFIFRDKAEGVEYISIMFEMKNEADKTATKHKNEDFFAKLDKDRREKGCEYAVLVSLLEQDSELYNVGIVDVSYRYPKMFVVRPQFFLSIIALLSLASRNSIPLKKELEQAKKQTLDVTHFEEKLVEFKDKFGRNYRIASNHFANAIKEIDKSIDHLTKVKNDLLGSDEQLRLANEKAVALTIRSLTRENPTMKKKFDEAHAQAKKVGFAEEITDDESDESDFADDENDVNKVDNNEKVD